MRATNQVLSPPPSPPKKGRRSKAAAAAAAAAAALLLEEEAARAVEAEEAASAKALEEEAAAAAALDAEPPSWLPSLPVDEFDYGSMYASVNRLVGARSVLSTRYSELTRIVDDHASSAETGGSSTADVGALPPPVTQSARTRAKQALWGDSPLALATASDSPSQGRWAAQRGGASQSSSASHAAAAVPAVKSSVDDALNAPLPSSPPRKPTLMERSRAAGSENRAAQRRARAAKSAAAPSKGWSGSTRVAASFGAKKKTKQAKKTRSMTRRTAARSQLEAEIGLTTSQVAAIVAQIKLAEQAAKLTEVAEPQSRPQPQLTAAEGSVGPAGGESWAQSEAETQRRSAERSQQSEAQRRRRKQQLKQKLLRQQQKSRRGGGAPVSLYDADGRRVRSVAALPAPRGRGRAAPRGGGGGGQARRSRKQRRTPAPHVTIGRPTQRRDFIARAAPVSAPPMAPSRRAPPLANSGLATDAIKFSTPPASPEDDGGHLGPHGERNAPGSIRRGTYWGAYPAEGSAIDDDPPVLLGNFRHQRDTTPAKTAKPKQQSVAPVSGGSSARRVRASPSKRGGAKFAADTKAAAAPPPPPRTSPLDEFALPEWATSEERVYVASRSVAPTPGVVHEAAPAAPTFVTADGGDGGSRSLRDEVTEDVLSWISGTLIEQLVVGQQPQPQAQTSSFAAAPAGSATATQLTRGAVDGSQMETIATMAAERAVRAALAQAGALGGGSSAAGSSSPSEGGGSGSAGAEKELVMKSRLEELKLDLARMQLGLREQRLEQQRIALEEDDARMQEELREEADRRMASLAAQAEGASADAKRRSEEGKEVEEHRVVLRTLSDAAQAMLEQSARDERVRAEREAEVSTEIAKEQREKAAALVEFQASLQQVAHSIQHEQKRLLEERAHEEERRRALAVLKSDALHEIELARVSLARERAVIAAQKAALLQREAGLEKAGKGLHDREELLMAMESLADSGGGGGGGSGGSGTPRASSRRGASNGPGAADVTGVPMVTVQVPQSQVWLWRPGMSSEAPVLSGGGGGGSGGAAGRGRAMDGADADEDDSGFRLSDDDEDEEMGGGASDGEERSGRPGLFVDSDASNAGSVAGDYSYSDGELVDCSDFSDGQVRVVYFIYVLSLSLSLFSPRTPASNLTAYRLPPPHTYTREKIVTPATIVERTPPEDGDSPEEEEGEA